MDGVDLAVGADVPGLGQVGLDLVEILAKAQQQFIGENADKAGVITKEKLREVAKLKMADLNTDDEEMAMNIIAGSARSMGVRVEG